MQLNILTLSIKNLQSITIQKLYTLNDDNEYLVILFLSVVIKLTIQSENIIIEWVASNKLSSLLKIQK
jgi:hypothetical protein